MRRVALITGLSLSLLLAACGGGGITPPPPPTPDEELVLGASDTYSYAAGEGRLYLVHAGLGPEIIHVELDRDVRLEVLNESFETEFSATTGDFFGAGSAGLAPAGLGTAAILDERDCLGTCIVFRPFGDFYVEVTNDSGSGATIEIDVFGRNFWDSTENFSYDMVSPPMIPAGGFDKGAIETVGDVDYWEVPATAELVFSPQSFPTEAYVLNQIGQEILGPLPPGESVPVFQGEYVRVWAVNADRAAIAGRSGYTLEHGNFPATVSRDSLLVREEVSRR